MASLPEHLSKVPVGRERMPREVLEAHQRERILDTSVAVFAKRGYQGTTVDHIVAAAHISVGSFYGLFDGKEDCFIQLYDRIVGLAWDRIAAEVPRDRSWPERAVAALRALLEWIAAEPQTAKVALIEAQTAGPQALARYEATLARLTPLLRRGREGSRVGDELPATLEDATVAGVAWLLHQRLVMGEVEGVEALLPELREIVVEPYLGVDLSRVG